MYLINQRKRIPKKDGPVLVIAAVFLCCAFLSTMVRADVKSIEDLEFNRVQLIGDSELELTQGEPASLKIRGSERDLAKIPFVIEDDTLVLGVTERGRVVQGLQFKLSAPNIEALLVEGSGETYVKPMVVQDLLVSLEGSGRIRMFDVEARNLEMRVIGSGTLQAVDVTATDARLHLKGSGDIQLGSLQAGVIKGHMAGSGDITVENGGKAELLDVSVMGSGDVALKDIQAETASVTIMGSGDVELSVSEELQVSIMGSGDLVYYGKPRVESTVMGSGDIRQRD